MKKGFTLIELLAIIIVLAVIAVIATPIVLNTISDAKTSANKSSVAMFANAVKLRVYEDYFKNQTYPSINVKWVNDNVVAGGGKVTCQEAFYDVTYGVLLHHCSVNGNEVGTNFIENMTVHAEQLYCYAKETVYLDCADTEYVSAYTETKLNFKDKEVPNFDLQTGISIDQNTSYDLKTLAINLSDNITSNDKLVITTNPISTTSLAVGTQTIEVKVTDEAGNFSTKTTSIVVNFKEISYVFNYTGTYQTFNVPITGSYQIELWGGAGGDAPNGGAGGYSKGTTNLTEGTNLYVYVGGKGDAGTGSAKVGGWNGGGASRNDLSYGSSGGGGATDIRLVSGTWNDATSLASRIIVAGGGGGYARYNTSIYKGGKGGGVIGSTGGSSYGNGSAGGTQTTGYALGAGAPGRYGASKVYGGGGGGYYGGAAATAKNGGSWYNDAGGGGSGFVPGHAGVVTSSNGYSFTSTTMTNGLNLDAGKAIITLVQ